MAKYTNMAKYINADALLEEIEKIKKYDYFAETGNIFILLAHIDVASVIKRRPAADVVEVVRCKDCKHSAPNGVYGCTLERFSAHDKSERLYSEDYCSCGERKDG